MISKAYAMYDIKNARHHTMTGKHKNKSCRRVEEVLWTQ